MTKITVEITINAPISQVWEKRTLPEHITKWNFATDDRECPQVTNDLQVGGKMMSTMRAKDKSVSFDFERTYTLVEDQKQIECVLDDGRKVSMNFEAIDEGTTIVTETFDAEETNPEELQRGGRQAILDNFKKYVENN
jgi:uncharacterized protein YndB with AHSA1/START domain